MDAANEAAPHPLALWNDYAKTIVGLASGVLAVLATFATNYIDRAAESGYALFALITASSFFAVAIALSIFVCGGIIGQARNLEGKRPLEKIALQSNLAFFALFIGMLSLVGFIYAIGSSSKSDASNALRVAEAFQAPVCSNTADHTLQAMSFDEVKLEWTVSFRVSCRIGRKLVPRVVAVVVRKSKITAVQAY